MRLSETFSIPSELAAFYNFVNSLDLRRYRDRGGQHEAFDALVSPSQATNWLRTHGLWSSDRSLDEEDFQRTLALRTALRDFLAIDPAMRSAASGALRRLEAAAASFPLTLAAGPSPPMLELRPRHRDGHFRAISVVLRQPTRVIRVRPVGPGFAGRLIGEPCARNVLAQIDDSGIGDVKGEGCAFILLSSWK